MHSVTFVLVLLCVVVFNEHTASLITDSESSQENRRIGNIIVEGKNAKRRQFPYQASLQKKGLFSSTYEHYCGGSIITPTFIVTAGHCVYKYSDVRVVAGLLKLDKIFKRDVQIAKAIATYVHPYYDSNTLSGVSPNDIGLIKVDKPFRYTKAVQPILLPEPGEETKGIVRLSGWGATSDGYNKVYPNQLQHISFSLLSFEECQQALNETLNRPYDDDENLPLTRTMLCTGSFLGHSSGCFGDSGGPIEQNNHLIGIASWVVLPCGKLGAPTMYTKTSYYIYFIREIVDDL